MSGGILTLTRPFTLRSSSTWHDLGHFFAKCKEICLLHCHLHKRRKNSQRRDFVSLCTQTSRKRRAAALGYSRAAVRSPATAISGNRETESTETCKELFKPQQKKSSAAPGSFLLFFPPHSSPSFLQVPHIQKDQWPAIVLHSLNFMLLHNI